MERSSSVLMTTIASRRGGLLCLFLAAFLLRFLAVLLWVDDLHAPPRGPPSADEVQFNNLARMVAQGQGYRLSLESRPTSFRAPGFPLFLAGLYATVGENYPLAYGAFCLLGAAACLFTFELACLYLTETGAWLAAIFLAIYLPHIFWATLFCSENLFIPCLTLGLWLFGRYQQTGSGWLLFSAGLTLGWATLTRPFALLLLPILLLLLLAAGWRHKQLPIRAVLILVFSFAGIIAPWTFRNYHVHGELVLITTNGGSTFYGGNNQRVVNEPRALGYWVSTTELPQRDLIDAQPTEVAHDRMEWQLGLDWIRAHPAEFALLLLYKLGRLWWLPEYHAGWRLLRIVSYVPFLVLFALGAWRCLRQGQLQRGLWLVLHGTMLATVVTALIFAGLPRFRDANAPLLMIYAVVGLGERFVRVFETAPQRRK